MNTKIRQVIRTRFIKSYANGVAKAMDANNDIRVFHKVKRSTVYAAWEDVGNDLTDVMLKHEEYLKEAAHAKR